MLYSEFIYQCVKSAANYGDSSMTYQAFLLGDMKQEQDYAGYLDKAYHEGNAFLQRCSSLGKIPTRIKEFEPIGADMAAELKMGDDFLKAVSVFQYDDDKRLRYTVLPFRQIAGKIYVLGQYSPYRKIYVQYRVKIPLFNEGSISWVVKGSENEDSYFVEGAEYDSLAEAVEKADAKQIDLTALYGIEDSLLMIGIDWVKGRIGDEVSLGHSQETEAESRLNDFELDEFLYSQRSGGKVA